MKLKEFNPETLPSIRGRQTANMPVISVNRKYGLIVLNIRACELLEVGDFHEIVIHQDEENPDCFYIEKVSSGGFLLKRNTGLSKGLFFSNTKMVHIIFDSVGFEGKSGRLLIAGKPTILGKRKMWGILTNLLKN